MAGRGWIVGGAVVVAVVLVGAGSVGWAQETPRAKVEPVAVPSPAKVESVAVPTPAVPVPPPKGALPLRLALPQAAPLRTAGALAMPTPPARVFGIVASATGGGGIFSDTANDAAAWLGTGGWGIQGYGNNGGGYFQSGNASGYAFAGVGDYGIQASGNAMGGFFQSLSGSGAAEVGSGDYGIKAWGNNAGGYFKGGNASGIARVGYGDYGIEAAGNTMGGYFKSGNASGVAYAGYGDYGIKAAGGTAGGWFLSANASGQALVGYGHWGIQAYGDAMGGYFKSANASGFANVGYGDYGIAAYGNTAGGYFNGNAGGYAYVGYSTYKIYGTGSVSFVQNHPADAGAVIVYAAPEGDEVATYTRGTARLVNGEAHVALGDTFKWVTNPDIGLTAHVTPRGDCNGVYVASVSTEELVVKELGGGSSNVVFDYLVYGLRIGFEETAVVQEKKQESFIPSMKDHRELLARRQDLAKYTALARYTGGRTAMALKESVNLDRANALKAAIHEFDPAVDKVPTPGPPQATLRSSAPAQGAAQAGMSVAAPGPVQQQVAVGTVVSGGAGGVVAVSSEQDIQARSFSSSREQLATRMAVAGAVEAGDVLVVDREQPGVFVRCERAADATVVGVVVADAGVALGSGSSAGSSAPVALSGIARCKVDASLGAIAPGDLLVSAPTPGYAMREASPLPGTVVGKALEPLAAGQGVIRILVTLR